MGAYLAAKHAAQNAFDQLKSLSSIENKSLAAITSKRDPRRKLHDFR
jgi:hypothetical protein